MMNRRRLTLRAILATMLALALVPLFASQSSATSLSAHQSIRPAAISVAHDGMHPMGVDCIGDGASCVGYLNGSNGEVDVTNNTNPHDYWRFKLTCLWGGDQYSGDNPPSAGNSEIVSGMQSWVAR